MVTHGKGTNFMGFNNLAFFTPFGFFLDMVWHFFSKDVWQPWLGVLNVKLGYVPSCKRPEFKLTPDQRTVFWEVTVMKKCIMASSGSLLVFCTAQKQDTFGSYDQTYTFVQPAVQTARWN